MRAYLLTWIGITDLRAALGFENSGGPILAALKEGQYTDVMLLAYTNSSKPNPEWESSREKYPGPSSPGMLDHTQEMNVVDRFSNTPCGHQIYKQWLETTLSTMQITTRVTLNTATLSHLNDTKGIYLAAANALELARSTPGDKRIIFYLSPGTPVMAFTWAFVSLTNPELDIRVIAASDSRFPPEAVLLPYELMSTSNRKKPTSGGDARYEFDMMFHLFGQQRLPSLLGIRQFDSAMHCFITSEKYPADAMKRFLPPGAGFEQIQVDPFDPAMVAMTILRFVSGRPQEARVGFNLTGGTKLMFAGALSACRKIGAVPFYFETRQHDLIFLHDYTHMPMRGIDNVELFFELTGFQISNAGKWNDVPERTKRLDLTRRLSDWKIRSTVSKLYPKLAAKVPRDGRSFIPFSEKRQNISAILEQNGRATVSIGGTEFAFDYCSDLARYLSGGWLEEYVYLLLEPHLKTGKIKDLRIGLEVSWNQGSTSNDTLAAQEFDVCYTDGNRLTIVECKAGDVLVGDVYKLENSVAKYGGVDAKGILLVAFPPRPHIKRRVLTSSSVSWMPVELIASRF